jgi:hypothetical protein
MKSALMHYAKQRFSILILLLTFTLIGGCTSVELSEPRNEIDIRAEVLALTCPDTVDVDEQFVVEIGYPNVCGGRFNRVDQYSGQYGFTLEPILRVSPEPNCPGVYPLETVARTISFGTVGHYFVVAAGRYGEIRKQVVVVSSVPRPPDFRLRFYFIDQLGAKNPGVQTRFWFPDRNPDESQTVQSDTAGYWSLTFTDTLSYVRYGINGMVFVAQKGIKESGIFLFP